MVRASRVAAWAVLGLTAVAHAGESAAFLFELSGAPAGMVSLATDGDQLTYRSEHFFDRERGAVREVTVPLAGVVPQSAWLWRRPRGCARVREELGGREGEACVESSAGATVRGRLLGEPFEARYRGGQLEELRLPASASRFVRWSGGPPPSGAPFGAGFAVPEGDGALMLVPFERPPALPRLRPMSEDGARELLVRARQRARAALDGGEGRADCLRAAQGFVALAGGEGAAQVVLGVVVDEGRAWPHAWVRVARPQGGHLELDPALGIEVTRATHLALAEPGRAFVELLAGRRHLERDGR